MLADLEGMFRLRTRWKGLSFEIARAEDVPRHVTADGGKLRQMLVNLLGNAVKFTNAGGVRLGISVRREGGGTMLLEAAVSDTGVGIRAEEVGLLFRDFEQTDSGRRLRSGTGLGLAISRSYARLMGGDISVESEVGQGSVFRLEVPVEPGLPVGRVPAEPNRRVRRIAPGSRAPRVLLVDDDATNREWLHALLEDVGFEVEEAADGQAALDRWRAWKAELVLMDIQMPVRNGTEATRAVRSEPGGERVVIVGLTASALQGEHTHMLECGADAVLRKPLRERELLELVRGRLGLTYVYDDAPLPAPDDAERAAVPLTREDLSSLPPGWLLEARAATRAGDLDRVGELIDAVDSAHAARTLRALVDRFDFEGLKLALGEDGASPCPTRLHDAQRPSGDPIP